MDSFAGLQIGDLVALRIETLQDAPWIVEVTGTEGEEISIVRMEGDYNSSTHTLKSCVDHLQLGLSTPGRSSLLPVTFIK